MQNYTGTGFIGDLFDLTFTRFISETLIRVLYIISIILAVVAAIIGIIAGFSNGVGAGISALILAPVFFFVYVVFARVIFEFVIVVFRIADYTHQIVENTTANTSEE